MVDLQGRVVEAVLQTQHLFELAPHGMAVGGMLDQHMSRQRGETTRDQPDMYVMDGLDRRIRHDVARYRLGVIPCRRCFQQHAAGIAEQSPCSTDHEEDHEERGNRVGASEADGDDEYAGDQSCSEMRRDP